MAQQYTLGKFGEYQDKGGWFLGQFMAKGTLQYDTALEVSVKQLPKGWGTHNEHPLHFHKCAKEIGIVTKGKARVQFDSTEIILSAGDFYILSQGCREKYLEVLEDMELITIKSPSVSNDKILI